MPLQTAHKPISPSIHPPLGVESKHQELHRFAFMRIFRHAFSSDGLTRILRHRTATHRAAGAGPLRDVAYKRKTWVTVWFAGIG